MALPRDTDYKKALLTIDRNMTKRPVNLELDDSILGIEYYDPGQTEITLAFKDLPREWIYINIAGLSITQDELTARQRETLTLYKKSTPRSNQTVAGMQNLGDMNPPLGNIILRRDKTNTEVSSGVTHEGYINTHYTLKSIWTDNVAVKKMIVQKDGKTIAEKDNYSQTGTIDITGLFYTGTVQENYTFIALDQNGNVAKEIVTLEIKIPEIEVIDLKKSGKETADIIAQISNDMDEGLVVFQRLRNGIRKDIAGTRQNSKG